MPKRSLLSRGPVLLLAGVVLMSCSSDGGSTSATTAPATSPVVSSADTTDATTSEPGSTAPAATDPTTTEVPAPSMRGQRYCEVLLVTPLDAGFTARVFNTYTLNECPADQWAAMDPAAIAAANGVPVALLNGPRYWLMDSITKTRDGEFNVVDFGGMSMNELAVVTVAERLDAIRPYVASSVDRKTVFTYEAGSTVYELTDPAGAVYVMQSWSQQADPELAEADLAGLGSRLSLPAGWTYSSRELTEPLEVVTVDEPAQVLQDDLRNSYSLETNG